MNTTELIEIARECGAEIYHEGEPGHDKNYPWIQFMTNELQQFAQRIEQPLLDRIVELANTANANLNAKDKQTEQLRDTLKRAWIGFSCDDFKPGDSSLVDAMRAALEQTK